MSGTLGSSTARTFTEWMQQHDKVSVSGASEGWKKEERRRWRQRQWSDGHSVSMECVPSSQGTPLIGSAGAVNTSKKHHPTPPRISSAQPPQPSQPPQPTKKRIISSAPPSVDSYEGDPLAQSCVSGRGGSRNEANHSSSDWKSFALFHEVKLRELLSDDHRLPERGRLKKVLNHFKEISGVFPLFATVFQLILSEINLSVYATAASTLGVIEKIPYFEIITSLQKEKESLKSELFDARMEANQDTLLYELHTSRSRNRYLTHQVDKLNQENENLLEDVAKLNNEAEALSKNGRQAFNDLELQNRKAQSEIRRLTNEHTLMSYDNRSRLANINDYLSFKNKVSGSILPLFENKHEFSTYVQLMCQLELAENFHLSDYDTDLWSLTPIEIPPVRQKLLQKLRVIRAELHTLESYCKVLLVKDPHSKPAQPDPCEYEDADSKEEEDVQFSNPYNDSKAVEVPGDRTDVADETVQLPVPDGGGAPNPVLWREPVNNADVGVPFKEVMCELSGTSSQGREQFVENLTKKSRSVAQDILLATVNSLGDRVAASDPVQALKDNYLVPLLSTDPKKLDYSIDMFAVNGVSQEHVKTIYNIEPSCVMDVPAKTSAVCLKFSKPAGSTTLLAEKELSAQQQQAVAAGQHVTEPQLVEDFIADDEMKTLRARPGSHAVWQIYTQKAGVYTPRAPRTLSLRITEQIIQAAYHDKRNVVLSVFLEISASGATKEVKEKQFGASLKETDLMDSLFSVCSLPPPLPSPPPPFPHPFTGLRRTLPPPTSSKQSCLRNPRNLRTGEHPSHLILSAVPYWQRRGGHHRGDSLQRTLHFRT